MSFITTKLNVGYNFTLYPNWARPVVLGRESPKAHGLNRTRVVERIFLPSTSSSN